MLVLNFDPSPALPGRSFHGWVCNCKHRDLPWFAYWIGINLGIMYPPCSDPHGSWTFSLLVTCSLLFLVVGIVGIALQVRPCKSRPWKWMVSTPPGGFSQFCFFSLIFNLESGTRFKTHSFEIKNGDWGTVSYSKPNHKASPNWRPGFLWNWLCPTVSDDGTMIPFALSLGWSRRPVSEASKCAPFKRKKKPVFNGIAASQKAPTLGLRLGQINIKVFLNTPTV